MLVYIAKRIGMTCVVLVLLVAFLTILPHLVPGDLVTTILGNRATPALEQTLRAQMGLDQSIPSQIGASLVDVVQGDLGTDYISQVPVTTLISNVLPHTIILSVVSLLLAVLIGIPLGAYAATRAGSWADRLIGIMSVSLITAPSYVIGLFLLLLFSLTLNVLPATGGGDLANPIDYLRYLILPATALSFTWVGYLARLVRASMLEVLTANHVRTARAWGLRERIVHRYALKNAIIPTVTVLGVGLGTLMSSTIFIEVIFTRPGLGSLVVSALETRNYPIVRGGVLTFAVLVMLANLLADLSYQFLDPRIRVGGRS
jgi:peptide/nickel transport system permease protein